MKESEKNIIKVDQERMLVDLNKLSGSELKNLLLQVFGEKIRRTEIPTITRQYESDRFLTPSEIPQIDFTLFDLLAMNCLPKEFRTVELSPVAPLGAASVVSSIHPNNVLVTTRNNEVLSDGTPSLAIEYEKIRRESTKDAKEKVPTPVHLFTSHRVIRAQLFGEERKGFTSHFRGIYMLSANRFQAKEDPILNFLTIHIEYYIKLLEELKKNPNFTVKKIKVSISSLQILETLISILGLDREQIKQSTKKSGSNFINDNKIEIPESIPSNGDIDDEKLKLYKIEGPYKQMKKLIDKITAGIKEKHPEIEVRIDLNRVAGIGYYNDICFKISAENISGDWFPLADGGFSNWTKNLAKSQKEISVVSGFGSEFFIKNFRNK